MMLKLVDTSQKVIILGIFILDKVTCLRALLDPPGWCLGIYRSVPLAFDVNVPGPRIDFESLSTC